MAETGKIDRWLPAPKNFGFITRDNGQPEAFCHHSELRGGYTTPTQGDKVSFDVGTGPKGPRATNVNLTPSATTTAAALAATVVPAAVAAAPAATSVTPATATITVAPTTTPVAVAAPTTNPPKPEPKTKISIGDPTPDPDDADGFYIPIGVYEKGELVDVPFEIMPQFRIDGLVITPSGHPPRHYRSGGFVRIILRFKFNGELASFDLHFETSDGLRTEQLVIHK